jgi:hypothetical protein
MERARENLRRQAGITTTHLHNAWLSGHARLGVRYRARRQGRQPASEVFKMLDDQVLNIKAVA